MNILIPVLLCFLILCAVFVTFNKDHLRAVLIFMTYSLVMSIIWVLLESPDLAITEAAVGAGVTTILFLITLKKIRAINTREQSSEEEESDNE